MHSMSLHLSSSTSNPLPARPLSDIRLDAPAGLSHVHLERWRALQRENPGLQSPYFRPEFTQAVARVRDDVEVAVFEDQGKAVGFLPFQRCQLNMGKPV